MLVLFLFMKAQDLAIQRNCKIITRVWRTLWRIIVQSVMRFEPKLYPLDVYLQCCHVWITIFMCTIASFSFIRWKAQEFWNADIRCTWIAFLRWSTKTSKVHHMLFYFAQQTRGCLCVFFPSPLLSHLVPSNMYFCMGFMI